MSDWAWVALGYAIAHGSLAGYLWTLRRRLSLVRARNEELR